MGQGVLWKQAAQKETVSIFKKEGVCYEKKIFAYCLTCSSVDVSYSCSGIRRK
jgi:hypothetical protein